MSRWERFELRLQPSAVTVRRAALWSSMGAAPRLLPVPGRAVESKEAWREPLQVAVRMLDDAQARGGALHVVLSDHFARYAVVPWSPGLVRDAERVAFARLTFSQTYGVLSDDWEIALDENLQAAPVIACALDRAFLQSLREICSARRMRLVSVAPAFVRALNRHRSALRGDSFWVARVESGRLTLALRDAGVWAALRTRRLDETDAQALASALRQEALACGASPKGSVYLMDMAGTTQSLPGWSVTRLGAAAGAAAAPQTARALAAK